ncbi:hypothetical protein AB0M19_36360 [Streptomyces sp. NPDC051920]|uniref:hypothetical protein n=1 Tax=Streptomyces sp. NPDC051920 TaxID=3155523 RepID=UPI00341B0044
MHGDDDNGRHRGGLSTEDLAHSTDTPAEAGASRAPTYPGESTATPGAHGRVGTSDAGEGGRADELPGNDDAATPSTGTRGGAEAPAAAGTASASSPPSAGPADAEADDEVPELLTDDDDRRFRDRWQAIQNQFVDDPREAVHAADALVAELMQTLATTFAQHKQELEGQWGHGEQVDTEALRRALRRYRSFFNRLLST